MELLPFGVTFLCCLFVNMEYGILIGAGVHLLLLAYMGNRPHPKILRLPVKQFQIQNKLDDVGSTTVQYRGMIHIRIGQPSYRRAGHCQSRYQLVFSGSGEVSSNSDRSDSNGR